MTPVTPAPAPTLTTLATSEGLAALGDVAKDLLIRFGGGLGILAVGWVVARVLAWATYNLLIRTDLDDRLAESLGLRVVLDTPSDKNRLERIVATVLYYFLMLFVVVAALQQAGLADAALPIQTFLGSIAGALPNIGKAGAILGVAYIVGLVAKNAVGTGLEKSGMGKRFAEMSEPGEPAADAPAGMTAGAGQAAFWLVMVVGLAGAADALQITPIAVPLRNAMDRVVSQIPSVGYAALIGAFAWVAARIARTVLENALASMGADDAVEKAGLLRLFAGRRPGQVAGLLAQAFILLQGAIAALSQLGLRTLSDPLTDMTARFWMLLPDLAVAGVILAIGWFGGSIARGVITSVLKGIGFDTVFARLGFAKLHSWHESLDEPSELVGAAVHGGLFLVAGTQVLENLGLHTWAEYVNGLLAYGVKNVAVALVIVGVGMALGNLVRDLITARNDADPEAQQWLGTVARYAVLVFAFTAAIRHLNVAEDFVMMSFGLLFGSLCLAIALAFGLGSREVAADIVKRQYERAQRRIEPKE